MVERVDGVTSGHHEVLGLVSANRWRMVRNESGWFVVSPRRPDKDPTVLCVLESHVQRVRETGLVTEHLYHMEWTQEVCDV